MLHAHVGAPVAPGCASHEAMPCWVCGAASERGLAVDDFMGANFVGQNRVRAPLSTHVCESCVWVMAGRPPDTFRMYSVFFEDGISYEKVNKGQKPEMREFLRRRHSRDWFAAIADSGQKHVIPWAPVNPGGSRGGRVLFEETPISLPASDDGWRVLDAMTVLLTAGGTKDEIASGAYESAWSRCPDHVRAFESEYGSARSSAFFKLAIWLAQRDEAVVQARMDREKEERAAKKSRTAKASPKAKTPAKREVEHDQRSDERAAQDAHGGGGLGDAHGVSPDVGCQRVEALGSAARADASSGKDDVRPGGMGNSNVPEPPVGRPQLSLF